jgi:hypothetical protein
MITPSHGILFAVCVTLCLACTPAGAQQALVRSYTDPAQSIGQAYLTHYGDRCIALLPGHVATEAGIPAFLSEGSKSLGESDDISDLGDDLGLARVTGSVTQDCGYSISTISRAVNNLISGQGLASLRSVNSDGTVANMSVAIVDNDGSLFLRVRPTNDRIQIRKGHSGSLLMIRDQPVGMLLSVSSRHGVGKVLRLDAMLSRAEDHMAGRAQSATQETPADTPGTKSNDLAAAANGGSVSGWNTLPVDAEHRPANLVMDEAAPPWRAAVEKWPAEFELDLAGDKVIISRIELDGRDLPDTGELPGRVEILVNISEGERRWRSLLSREADFSGNGVAVFSFAPTWARQVRIAIGSSQGGGNVVGLRRIRISNP